MVPIRVIRKPYYSVRPHRACDPTQQAMMSIVTIPTCYQCNHSSFPNSANLKQTEDNMETSVLLVVSLMLVQSQCFIVPAKPGVQKKNVKGKSLQHGSPITCCGFHQPSFSPFTAC